MMSSELCSSVIVVVTVHDVEIGLTIASGGLCDAVYVYGVYAYWT